MRKIVLILTAALCFAACDNDKPTPTPPPSSEEAVLELTSEDSAWFDADGGNGVITYTLENSVKEISLTATPSVEWIETSVGETVTYTVAKNESEEERRGTITVAYGDKSFQVSVMQRAQLNADVMFEAESLDGSIYVDMSEESGCYNYNIMLSKSGLTQSGNMYADTSYYIFDLYSDTPAEGENITIPVGEYTLGIDKAPGVVNNGYSKLIDTSNATNATTLFTDARIVVSEGKIEAYLTLEDSKQHYVVYEGSLTIKPYEEDKEGFSTLRRDYYFDINDGVFVGAYMGNYYHSSYDTCSVYLFEELDLETGEEFGDEFQLDLQLPRGGTDICGTYTPGTAAGNFIPGDAEDVGDGQYMQINTWYMTAGYTDFAPLVDGTITVEKDENDIYTFTIDCIDDKGHKIVGKFRGWGEFTEW